MGKRILLIEDEPAIQKILFEPLTAAGYKVISASDGLEGINVFHSQVFDLVLLDIMLPKINGYAVCEMIRQESKVPIILLTALDTEDAQIKGFDLLADDYITKPFSIKLVVKRVEALLRRTSTENNPDVIRYKEITLNGTRQYFYFQEDGSAFTDGYKAFDKNGKRVYYYFQKDGTAYTAGYLSFAQGGKQYYFYFQADGSVLWLKKTHKNSAGTDVSSGAAVAGPSSATRTHDLHIPNVARYQLRYTRVSVL